MTDEPVVLDEEVVDAEAVDELPVLAEVRPIEVAAPSRLGAVQATAMAATGFVAGAATLAVVQRLASRKLGRLAPAVTRRPHWEYMPVQSTRTYIVDVYTLGKPGE
jgi:phage FluMu protein gp41